jgi:hypothetical protein
MRQTLVRQTLDAALPVPSERMTIFFINMLPAGSNEYRERYDTPSDNSLQAPAANETKIRTGLRLKKEGMVQIPRSSH